MSDGNELLAAVLRAQGLVFIRELFRGIDGLALGGNKNDLEERAQEALASGLLTETQLREWLVSVEGWGQQHVFAKKPSAGIGNLGALSNRALATRLAGSSFKGVVGTEDSMDFPDVLTPTGAIVRDGRVRLTWHVRADRELRVEAADFTEVREGDEYHFKAFRVVPERHTVRLQIDLGSGTIALFDSVPSTSSIKTDELRVEAWSLAQQIVRQPLEPLDLSRAIAVLAGGTDPTISARRRQMEASGASVQFSAMGTDDYHDSPEVSQVAATASTVTGFTNRLGDFSHASATTANSPARDVTVKIDQKRESLWVRARLEEPQMWNLITLVVDASNS